MDPLRISMVGLSKWESVFVQTSVDLASGVELPPCRFVEDPKIADVLLVDANHRRHLPAAHSDRDTTPIVVSFTGDADAASDGRGLTRPVGYAELISVLNDIEIERHEISNVVKTRQPVRPEPRRPGPGKEQVRPEPVKQQVRPEPAKPSRVESDPATTDLRLDTSGRASETLAEKDRPARRFVAGTRLLGILGRISLRGTPAEVKHPRFPTLLISPEHNIFISTDNPLRMPAMFRDSAMSYRVDHLGKNLAEAVLTLGSLRPLSHLVYCAALFGSEGRLMLNSNVEDRLSLLGTPDFDAVPQLPEHMSIARYMIGNVGSLADIAQATGVSISVVIDFCNACDAIGLVRRDTDGQSRQRVDENGVAHLLERVRHLFRDS